MVIQEKQSTLEVLRSQPVVDNVDKIGTRLNSTTILPLVALEHLKETPSNLELHKWIYYL